MIDHGTTPATKLLLALRSPARALGAPIDLLTTRRHTVPAWVVSGGCALPQPVAAPASRPARAHVRVHTPFHIRMRLRGAAAARLLQWYGWVMRLDNSATAR